MASPPSLNEAVELSMEAWQKDLEALFRQAKDRFADVVWELLGEDEVESETPEEVWGHKAIVYARAPPSFQARYFSFRPAPAASPMLHYSPVNRSTMSLNGDPTSYSPPRSVTPYGSIRTQSPSPSSIAAGQPFRLSTTIAPALFSNELEYLYTGKGFGEAFEFLFETNESKAEENTEAKRIDKLRKDLIFMWRSRLYSDVRLSITGLFHSSTIPEGEESSAEFSSHRFILVSRSPYFQSQLLGDFAPPTPEPSSPVVLTLPSPPFTPASLHFVLGYIYAGTVAFSNRTFDLDTAFHILRSAMYLSLTSLCNEMQARIAQEMVHGLFHAFLDFNEYEQVTGGRWGVGGCKCKTCARRAPRVLEFAIADDIKNKYLERGAQRAIVGHFGEGWCTSEFATLPQKTRESFIKGVSKRATPINILPLLIAGQQALIKLDKVPRELWSHVSREGILSGLKHVGEALCLNVAAFLEEPEWLTILEADGARFEDIERVEWVMDSIRQGLSEKTAGLVYQALVSAILIRPHPVENGDTLLPATSRVRALVERTREDVLRYLRIRWINVRQESGFNDLEGWALKEISHEIEVPVDDLYNTTIPSTIKSSPVVKQTPTRIRKAAEDDTSSLASSLRPTSLQRSVTKTARTSPSVRSRPVSSASSVRTVSTTASASSMASAATVSTVTRSARSDLPGSTISKKTESPSVSQVTGSSSMPSRLSSASRTAPSSSAASVKSLRAPSMVTVTRPRLSSSINSKGDGASVLSRSASSVTSRTETSFKSARSELSASTSRLTVPRQRKQSGASEHSTSSYKSTSSTIPTKSTVSSKHRVRRDSNASVKSTASQAATSRSRRVVPPTPAEKNPPRKGRSVASVRSTTSTKTAKAQTSDPPPPVPDKDVCMKKLQRPSPMQVDTNLPHSPGTLSPSSGSIAQSGSDDASTIKDLALAKKTSVSTITAAPLSPLSQSSVTNTNLSRGVSLNVGIPCIVTSMRSRFRAFARYIGEVEGENGPWVGVEVPIGESWGSDKLEGRQWNDGSWGGIQYFQINHGSEWEEAQERDTRRRRLEQINSMVHQDSKGVKRGAERLSMERAKRMRSASPVTSETSISDVRGLFVRPQQILYVIGAVDADV